MVSPLFPSGAKRKSKGSSVYPALSWMENSSGEVNVSHCCASSLRSTVSASRMLRRVNRMKKSGPSLFPTLTFDALPLDYDASEKRGPEKRRRINFPPSDFHARWWAGLRCNPDLEGGPAGFRIGTGGRWRIVPHRVITSTPIE